MSSSSVAASLAFIALAAYCTAALAQPHFDLSISTRPSPSTKGSPTNQSRHTVTLRENVEPLNHTNTGIPRLDIPVWGDWNQPLHSASSEEPGLHFGPWPPCSGGCDHAQRWFFAFAMLCRNVTLIMDFKVLIEQAGCKAFWLDNLGARHCNPIK